MNATSYPYDLTNISNTNSTVGFITEVNHLTGDFFMLGVLLVVTVVTFMAMLRYGAKEALVVSLFINSLTAAIFYVLGWIALTYLIIFIVIFGITLSMIFSSGNG